MLKVFNCCIVGSKEVQTSKYILLLRLRSGGFCKQTLKKNSFFSIFSTLSQNGSKFLADQCEVSILLCHSKLSKFEQRCACVENLVGFVVQLDHWREIFEDIWALWRILKYLKSSIRYIKSSLSMNLFFDSSYYLKLFALMNVECQTSINFQKCGSYLATLIPWDRSSLLMTFWGYLRHLPMVETIFSHLIETLMDARNIDEMHRKLLRAECFLI